MKSKSFWKQFAFELGVLFVWPIIFIGGGGAMTWLAVNGYFLEMFFSVCSIIVLAIVGSFVSLAWERAENAENMRDE